ncbi:hypothetical protein BJY52DRAFT_1227718 [Lactarius psammicola]|nr:hypothetical protein BJY52DRAFT_1227718 [Lactarius psammicola]
MAPNSNANDASSHSPAPEQAETSYSESPPSITVPDSHHGNSYNKSGDDSSSEVPNEQNTTDTPGTSRQFSSQELALEERAQKEKDLQKEIIQPTPAQPDPPARKPTRFRRWIEILKRWFSRRRPDERT